MKTLLPPSWLCVSILLLVTPNALGQNGLLREVYNNVTGGLDGLRANPNFPGNPALVEVVPEFETPGGFGDLYGQRVRGYIEPPQTGNYIFWIASDDQSQLYLSSDEQPHNATVIAEVFNWTESRQWDLEPNQRSQAIRLEQGRRYYIQALHVEGQGGDHLAVRWQLPDGTIEEPIPNGRVYVELVPPQISRQPANLVVTEGQSAEFAVELSNLGPVAAQWLRNGVEIPGATNLTLLIPVVTSADSGTRFQVRLTNRFAPAGILSSTAFLTVSPDLTPPALVAAHASGNDNLVTLVFSEPLEVASALSLVNYSISRGVQVLGAAISANGRAVILRTSPLLFGETYEVFVDGLRDRANNPNTMVETERAEFMYGFTPLHPDIVLGKAETPGPSTRRTALTISEIMYNPIGRDDGRNLEFVELYNSQESLQTIGGYRLTGPIEYTFPEGTFIPARTNLVVARVPGDVQAVHGLPRVYGPYTNNLPDSGTLRLLNDQGAVLLEVPYSAEGDWPAAPDGAGPSLVLVRPSYGEADPRAWAASEFIGGTPGRAETAASNPYRGLVINEFLATSDRPAVDFIELYNHSGGVIDLSGMYLSDSPSLPGYRIPDGTLLGPLEFKVFTETELGFGLDSSGEAFFLKNPARTRVIDAVAYRPQSAGVSRGRFPDGNREFRTLSTQTPGAANARPELPQVVINEIMYNPVSGNQEEEYVELFNRGSSTVNLKGWRLQDGISFTFVEDFSLAAGAYVILARNIELLRANHPSLNAANSLGNFNGNLANDGERIALHRPELRISENNPSVTNILDVVVDDVSYGTGGRWPQWADGGGSSLELIDSAADNNDASSWADSDETQKSSWVTLEYRGVLDHGASNFAAASPSRNLHVLMMDQSEALLDNVQVFRDGGANIVSNPGFESGFNGWVKGGTHEDSAVQSGAGPDGSAALHIRTTERGDTAANLLRVRLSESLTNGTIATIRAQARWLRGTPEILFRLHGNYLELAGAMPLPKNLGTPAAPNSRRVANAGPSISETRHLPLRPVANQQVEVIAQIDDPDQVALAQLFYRVDPVTNYTRVPMVYRGAGFYSGAIPGQSNLATVAFYIEALDSRGAANRFPAAAEAEGVILFGDGALAPGLSTYRLWLTARNLDRWQRREQSSNKPLDATFVYNEDRVVYNMGAHYSGSPFHWRGYSGPLGSSANYMMTFPKDDLFLGQTDFVLMLPSNLGSDNTGIREQVFYWMAGQLNQPYNHRRYHHLFINGRNRGLSSQGVQRVYEDTQQPNRDMIEQWFPEEAEGHLYKIEDWFEFNDALTSFQNRDATLLPFVTTNLATGQPEFKRAAYRWMFRKRAVRDSAHDYTELLRLVAAVNHPDRDEYIAQTRALLDIDQWMGAIALRHVVGDWDAFGYGRGKNMYAYKPANGKWRLMHWDIAFAFGLGDGPQTDLFATIEAITARMMETPEFLRAYLRALSDAANGPMAASLINAVIDAKYLGLVQNGIAATSPDAVKRWIADRRTFILQQLAGASAPFAITSNNGNNFTTNRNALLLQGTAPVQAKTIRINGIEYPVRWTSLTAWELQLALDPQQNLLVAEAYDSNGRLISQGTDAITVTVTGAGEDPIGRLVFNEIQYHPAVPGTEFVELFNASTSTAFDLSGYRINGLGFTFPPGVVIAPRRFLVLAENAAAFGGFYGFTVPVAAQFDGRLSDGGEALSLIAPDGTTIVASVRYDSVPPWPVLANGTGASLQLIDAQQDASRVSNWSAQAGIATPGSENSIRASLPAFPRLWVNEVQPENLEGAVDSAGDRDPWVEIYNSGASAVVLSGMHLTDDLANLRKWAFPGATTIGPGERKVVWLDAEPAESTGTEIHAAFRAAPASGIIALVSSASGVPQILDYLSYQGLAPGLSYGAYPDGQAVWRDPFYRATPGAPNDITPPPARIFINEWMTSNSRTIQDPDDLDFDDWFELYNAGPVAVDLGGYTLTDNPANPDQSVIPAGTLIPPGGFLLVWADDENATNGQLHVSFRLSADGEMIGLYAPDGSVMDLVAFGSIPRDVSGGRLPDGGAIANTLPFATPGFSNSGEQGGIAFTSVALANGQVLFTWKTGTAATFAVQYKDDLRDANWTHLRTVVGSGGTASTTDTSGERQRFYRIVEQ